MIKWLGEFPSTNGAIMLGIAMWSATCVVALILAFHGREVPGSWYTALNLYTGTVVAQFGLKRFSDVGYRAAGKGMSGGTP